MNGEIRTCYGCNNLVVLVTTDRGALLPLEPEPNETGRLAVSVPGPGRAPRVRYLRGDDAQLAAGEQRMTAHWDLHPACKGERKKRNHGSQRPATGTQAPQVPRQRLAEPSGQVSDEATQAHLEAQARAAIARLRAPG